MPLDDPAIPSALKEAAHRGSHIILATARGYRMIGSTERQLEEDGVLNLIEKNAIQTPDHHISFPGFYFPAAWHHNQTRHIAYIHGILYLSGQNKGVMLQQFLAKTKQTKNITSIIFVDDTMQNVIDVAKAFANDPNVNVTAIHFTRLAAHKAAFTKGKNAKKLQAIATQRWENIKITLQKNLLGSIV
jgi:hydroxymethylpyrimidine pyrophosphatase-like HAD family hydrolase